MIISHYYNHYHHIIIVILHRTNHSKSSPLQVISTDGLAHSCPYWTENSPSTLLHFNTLSRLACSAYLEQSYQLLALGAHFVNLTPNQ